MAELAGQDIAGQNIAGLDMGGLLFSLHVTAP